MRIFYIFMFICFLSSSANLEAQKYAKKPKIKKIEIPTVDDKVLFSDTIVTTLTHDQIRSRLLAINDTVYDNSFLEIFENYANKKIICDAVDLVVVNNKLLTYYSLYMSYQINFEIIDNICIQTIKDIRFDEIEAIDDATMLSKKDLELLKYTAEEILVEKKIKKLIISNFGEKVAETLYNRTREIKLITQEILQ